MKPLVEITNVLPKDKKDESRIAISDRKLRTRKVENIPFESQITVEAQQPRNKFVFQESNNQLKRAVSAPPAFNFASKASVKHMDVTQPCIDTPRDKGTEEDIELKTFKEWLDSISDLSDEESGDAPRIPNNVELTCCDNWKEYCMSRVSEEPNLCGRCNRHYQIYGMQWPIRRIKPICPRLKNKGVLAIEAASRSASPSPSPVPEKDPSPSCSPKNAKWKLSQTSAPPIRYKMAVRLASVNGLKKLKPKPLAPSAASYETDPVIINAQASNLSIPTIHTNNLPVQHKHSERSLVIEMEDKLAITKPFKRTTRETPYRPVSLQTDILDRQSQLSKLQERQQDLLQLRARLHHVIYSQRQNEEKSTSILYIPTPDSGTPQPHDLEMIDEDVEIDIVDIQQESCEADAQLKEVRSDISIDLVCCNEEGRNVGETPPSLDEHSDTASPASITTPIYSHTSDDKKSDQQSSEQRESTVPSTIALEESRSIAGPTLDDLVTETGPTTEEESSTEPASSNDGIERHTSPESEIIDVVSIYDNSFITPTTLVVPKECSENNQHIDSAHDGHEEISANISEETKETVDKMALLENQSDTVATQEADNLVNCAADVLNPVNSNDLNDTQKCPPPNVHVDQSLYEKEIHENSERRKVLKAEDSDKQQDRSKTSLPGKGKEEDTPSAIHGNPGEITPISVTLPMTVQVKREDVDSPNNVDNLINENSTSCEGLDGTEQNEAVDPPSPTFTEILEYAVSPKSASLDDLSSISAAGKDPVVKQEIVEETPRLRSSSNTLWRRRSKRTAVKQKADVSENIGCNRVEAAISSEVANTSCDPKVTSTNSLDFKPIVKPKRPVVNTSTIPDLCNILNKPPSSSLVQPPVDFLALVNHEYRPTMDYQLQEQYSFMSTIASIRGEYPADVCDTYHTVSQNNAQKSTCDHSCTVPSFKHIFSQSHYNSNSSNSHSSYSSVEGGHAVKREYDHDEEYRTLLQSVADQEERARRPFRKQQSDQSVETFATYPPLPSFQNIVNQELPPYLYPLMEEYRSTYTEPSYATTPTTSSTALAVVSLISQEREQSNTTIPQITHIPRYDSITHECSVEPPNHLQHHSTSLKGKSPMHFSSRPSDAASPSPVPQQPPMKVSFLLQPNTDEKSTTTKNSNDKTKTKQKTPDTVEVKKRVSPRTRAREENNAKAEKLATSRRATKTPAPKKNSPKTSAAPKRKARVGCPIAPPQRDPPLSAEMVKKTLRLKRYNGVDLLNPFVPRIAPTPTLTSMSAQYNRSPSKPYIPNGPGC